MPFFRLPQSRRPMFRSPSVAAPAKPPIITPAELKGGVRPIHFFAEVDLDANTESPVRSDAINNRAGETVEIHEIRFTAFTPTQTQFNRVDCGSFVRVRATYGNFKITNSYIPIWLLGKTEQIGTQLPINPATSYEGRAVYVWRLSTPWILSPKIPLSVSFQHSGGTRFGARAQISLAGRVIDRRPTTTAVPYAAAYVSKPFTYSTADYDESSEGDIVNALGRKVSIERIAGRVALTQTTAAGFPTAISDVYGIGPNRTTQLRLDSSTGVPILRDYSTFRSVFGYQRSIEVPFNMDANEFLRARIKNVAGPAIAVPYVTYYAQAHVAIIGSREEVI